MFVLTILLEVHYDSLLHITLLNKLIIHEVSLAPMDYEDKN